MTLPVALVDCDGVLADFATPILQHCNALTGRNVRFSEINVFEMEKLYPELTFERVFEPCTREGFCLGLDVFPGALSGIAELRRVARVVALTAPWWPSKHWHADRMTWLIEKMGFAEKDIIFASEKHLVRGDIIVDDREKHVASWCEANPDRWGFLWKRPYNRDSGGLPANVSVTHYWGDVCGYAQAIGGRRG